MTNFLLAKLKSEVNAVSAILLIIPSLVYVMGFAVTYFPFILLHDIFIFLWPGWLVAAILWLALQLLLNDRVKTDMLMLVLSANYFFFSAWHDRMVGWFGGSPFSRYGLHLLLALGAMFFLILLFVRTKKSLERLRKAVLVAFLAVFAMESGVIAKAIFEDKTHRRVYAAGYDGWSSGQWTLNNDDLYILVVDELASSRSLQQGWGINNETLDSSLQRLGMQIIPEARSPYFFTHFSMAAFFNQDYLVLRDPEHITYADYIQALRAQRESCLIASFEKKGYAIFSYSPFPLRGNTFVKGSGEEPNLLVNLYQQTAIGRIWKDLGWHIRVLYSDSTAAQRKREELFNYHEFVEHSIIASASDGHKERRLVYGHFFLAHQPLLWDGPQRLRTLVEVFGDSTNERRTKAYAANLSHVNVALQHIVSQLLSVSHGKINLIVMGDHGLRLPGVATENYFRPFCAVYTSNHHPSLPDSINTVNLLRKLLYYPKAPYWAPDKMIILNDQTNFDRSK